nr:hypothetical protein [Tanacetum cinerariifolium]
MGKKFAMQYSKPEDPNELFQKLLEDLKELAEYDNSPSRDRSISLNDDENHSVQNEESLENSSNEIATSNSNEEKEEPPQDFDIHQLIREECYVEVCEKQKQKSDEIIKSGVEELVPILRASGIDVVQILGASSKKPQLLQPHECAVFFGLSFESPFGGFPFHTKLVLRYLPELGLRVTSTGACRGVGFGFLGGSWFAGRTWSCIVTEKILLGSPGDVSG